MNEKLRDFLKTGKGKLTIACGALLISWIFLLTQIGGNFSSWFPNEGRREALRKEIKKTVYAMARLYHTPRKPADTAENGGSPAAD